ncbi:MAG: DUF4956 domain-containing protein [Chitinispirillaceae bacterium]|nr:DUF4956 domain-containing protein [Chitinispirillaceae bacterium]
MLDFLTLQTEASNPTFISVIYTTLLSFILSMLIALTYERTYRGLSYSRNYVQALILSSIVAAMIMQAIGDSLGRGLGMIGALSIIRFRTVFKDPKDIIFMFASLAAGISCGVFGYSIAVAGTVAFCLVAFFLYMTPFGQERYYDGMLRFNMETNADNTIVIEKVLKTYCKNFALITLRELAQGNRLDYAYHVKLRKSNAKNEFVNRLRELNAINDVHLLLQETTVEQ